jgi:hypothetical protein
MKKHIRTAPIVGIGVLTPALTGHPQAATARSIDHVDALQNEPASSPMSPSYDRAKVLMAVSLLDLNPSEKLKLAGNRIPALSITPSKTMTRLALTKPYSYNPCIQQNRPSPSIQVCHLLRAKPRKRPKTTKPATGK